MYRIPEDLPVDIREELPVRAQQDFIRGYNESWWYAEDEEVLPPNTKREEFANLGGWNAVTSSHQQIDGEWKPKY